MQTELLMAYQNMQWDVICYQQLRQGLMTGVPLNPVLANGYCSQVVHTSGVWHSSVNLVPRPIAECCHLANLMV